tara:strand:- start:742 stop:1023 length:282 start_codon:yes stop_codon:yes gene_type:complete
MVKKLAHAGGQKWLAVTEEKDSYDIHLLHCWKVDMGRVWGSVTIPHPYFPPSRRLAQMRARTGAEIIAKLRSYPTLKDAEAFVDGFCQARAGQ